MRKGFSGILLHPSSLPSAGGIGDFGPAAYEFIEFLTSAKQSVWQILPLAPVGYGNSPYSSLSAFAGNPMLISLERLAEHGWIPKDRIGKTAVAGDQANYDEVRVAKLPLLKEAAQSFLTLATPEKRAKYEEFCNRNAWWLNDYALFEVLREHFNADSWNHWPKEIARRTPEALHEYGIQFQPQIEVSRALQYAFWEQWRALRHQCRKRGIRIAGDVAIFVNYDSADVWTHPDIFRLDENLEPEVVAGVPPDAFSETGQRWGNPLYRWDVLQSRGYEWWVQRMRWSLEACDLIRLDHFRGFEAFWEIPAHEPTALHGRWVKGPGDDLFNVLRQQLGDLPFFAEDLGLITREVDELRQRLQIPGMKVLQFGFGDPGAHIYLPHRFDENSVVYTGTHDNDTTVGWWKTISETERNAARAYFGEAPDGINWSMIRAALTSVARYAIIPLQDVLGLGSEARINTPSRPDGNWGWRFRAGSLQKAMAEKLARIVEVTDREPELGGGQNRDGEGSEDFAA